MKQSAARWLVLLSLPVLIGQIGCGSIDGGPVGTGIAASVVGNVVAVEDFDSVDTAAQIVEPTEDIQSEPTEGIQSVADIEVSLVEFPELDTTTDTDGNFRLDGEFSGPVTLRFTAPELDVEQPLEVPSGGLVVLSDIELGPEGVLVDAGEQLGLIGQVRQINCGLGRLRIEDRGGNFFDATLIEETAFLRGEQTAACEDIRVNDKISLEGILEDLESRWVTALEIQLDPKSTPPPSEREVPFVGYLVVIDCARNTIIVEQGKHLRRLALTSNTVIRQESQRQLTCEDLELGQWVQGKALVSLQRPNLPIARTVVVRREADPDAQLRIRGFLAAKNCEAATLELANGDALFTIRVLSTTDITPNGRCADLRTGASVRGWGVVSKDLPGALDATSLNIRRVRDK